jgi:hypothetical protein
MSRVARLFSGQNTNTGKNIPNDHKIPKAIKETKWLQNGQKNTNIFIARTSKIYPNRIFWFGNVASGNLATDIDTTDETFECFF